MTCFDEEPEHQPTKDAWDAYEAKQKAGTNGYCVRYLMPPDDRRGIYHLRDGKPVGLPIAFARADMWGAVDNLVANANRGLAAKKSIYTRNRRPEKEVQP